MRRIWINPKRKGEFVARMVIAGKDVVFQLQGDRGNPITFESWQAAKKAGWVKVK